MTKHQRWLTCGALLASNFFNINISEAASVAKVKEVKLDYDSGGQVFPRWSGGTLVEIEGEVSSSPLVRLFDRNGRLLSAIPFSIPGVQKLTVAGFAHGEDGTVALCGTAVNSDGRAASYIAWLSPDGQKVQVVRSERYYARRVAVARDGTVWTQGVETLDPAEVRAREAVGKSGTLNLTAAAIRHFGQNGAVTEAFVPQSTMQVPDTLSGENFIVASGDHIGWYSDRESRYIEFSGGAIVRDISGITRPDGARRASGFGLTEDGHVFASFRTAAEQEGIYVLDASRRGWLPLTTGSDLVLYGADGNNLVTRAVKDRFHLAFLSPLY